MINKTSKVEYGNFKLSIMSTNSDYIKFQVGYRPHQDIAEESKIYCVTKDELQVLSAFLKALFQDKNV